jgi:uncharacterized membrane protein
MEHVRTWIEMAAAGIEALAVAIIVSFIAIVTVRWLFHIGRKADRAHERYRVAVGKSLLVGLELLMPRTLSGRSLWMHRALELIRTFLGWTLSVEVEGRCPWRTGTGG